MRILSGSRVRVALAVGLFVAGVGHEGLAAVGATTQHDLGSLGAASTAYSVNDHGEALVGVDVVAGDIYLNDGSVHAFYWAD
jgi:hypothetical protein